MGLTEGIATIHANPGFPRVSTVRFAAREFVFNLLFQMADSIERARYSWKFRSKILSACSDNMIPRNHAPLFHTCRKCDY